MSSKQRKKYKVFHPFNAADASQISIVPGDVVEVLQETPSGWWYGLLRGKKGYFPSNHVEPYDEGASLVMSQPLASSPASSPSSSSATTNEKAGSPAPVRKADSRASIQAARPDEAAPPPPSDDDPQREIEELRAKQAADLAKYRELDNKLLFLISQVEVLQEANDAKQQQIEDLLEEKRHQGDDGPGPEASIQRMDSGGPSAPASGLAAQLAEEQRKRRKYQRDIKEHKSQRTEEARRFASELNQLKATVEACLIDARLRQEKNLTGTLARRQTGAGQRPGGVNAPIGDPLTELRNVNFKMTTLRSTLNLGFDEFQPVEKEGFMIKKAMGQSKVGRSNKKKRWFELRGNVLKYYASEGPPRADPKAQLKGSLELNYMCQLEVISRTEFKLNWNDKSLVCQLDNEEDLKAWRSVLDKKVKFLEYENDLKTKRLPADPRIQQIFQSKELTSIYLDGFPLTAAAIGVIVNSLSFNPITTISIKNTELDDKLLEALAKGFKPHSQVLNTLTDLDLSENKLTAEGAKLLAAEIAAGNLSRLSTLNLSDNQLGDEALTLLAPYIPAVERFDLTRTNITDSGVLQLSQVLEQTDPNGETFTLFLAGNKISDRGAAAIAKLCESYQRVEKLKLAGNKIRDKGAQALSRMLKNNKTIVELDLRNNEIADTGASDLAKVLSHRSKKGVSNQVLTSIDLSENLLRGGGKYVWYLAPEWRVKELVLSSVSEKT